MKVEAVVLANGEYPTAPLPLQILADAPYVVCCDGGADEYIRNGHTPNLIIGDGDSISEENRKKYGLVYPLSDFTNWWQGTLNECIGTEFTIEAEGEYLVFLNFPQPLPQSTR